MDTNFQKIDAPGLTKARSSAASASANDAKMRVRKPRPLCVEGFDELDFIALQRWSDDGGPVDD